MIWKVGVCHRPQKQKKYFLITNNCSKRRTYRMERGGCKGPKMVQNDPGKLHHKIIIFDTHVK